MNEEQREFLVTKVEKYNEEIDKINGGIKTNVFMLGAMLSALVFSVVNMNSGKLGLEITGWITAMAGSFYAAGDIRKVVQAIVTKAGLSNRIDEIEEKLELDNLVQTKGMRR